MLETPALVLHAFDYRETSRIVRLATRDVGVVSVVARGARRPRNRFGPALDLFASGTAHIAMHASGDLHALHAFDAAHPRRGLAASLDRFGAASVIAELCLRFGREADTSGLHDAAAHALDRLVTADAADVVAVSLAGAWRLVTEFGFAPQLDQCASCHAAMPTGADVTFHYRAGGVLCATCARHAPGGGRRLPATAWATLQAWAGGHLPGMTRGEARAHLRLLREFLEEHLADGRPLRALLAFEKRHAAAAATADA